ncbi:MAG: Gfo/Idh/MocA family oxidoreductase [Gaiellaceae bacterium MAG52_C11]|nr:Gfo/Idh/MocA family oxidoreductase [Candidatus Gaiellasilicea maunaloa]
MRVALAGAGNIADRYAAAIVNAPELELAGATDPVPGRAAALVAAQGGVEYPTLEALLADEAVDTVVNLTSPQAHFDVSEASLDAQKHVHSEKPLALTHDDARALVERARRNGVRLSSAPTTLLGEAQQTAWKLVREGAIGTVRAVYAEANWGRLEAWHPDSRSLYAVGPLVDVGVYPLTIVTAMLGPVRRVQAFAKTLEPERRLLDGTSFVPESPDFVVASVELAEGVLVRLTASFYVGPCKQRGLELHGDAGSLYLPTWAEADSLIEQQVRGGEYAKVAPVRRPFHGVDWGRALVDLAHAVDEGRPHRSSGEHAAHVVEVFDAVRRSLARGGLAVEVQSDFRRPEPMDWAR